LHQQKNISMEYISIENFKEEEQQEIVTTLTMADLKILHNAMVDILKEYPMMSSYYYCKEKLERIIIKETNE
jgi:hypothetical protein